MEVYEAALHMYGQGHSNAHYIRRLASDLRLSESMARKVWYGARRLSPTAQELLRMKVGAASVVEVNKGK